MSGSEEGGVCCNGHQKGQDRPLARLGEHYQEPS